ncbi:sulfatase-like hydrolase/transferase [Phenylobacterium sp. J367]|uniref:sulfatase-like hydrolase/transferase n=1 Tax=Phenylobacterium sp. J367 TaxID=2898435 RepID=UPI0027E30D23|nr:sulfatase-like hydrolase/transferase [Phenylobacterium sp. J367]
MRRPSSASATRCRSGRRARSVPTTNGRPARGSNISTGSSGGEANQWYPSLYEGTTPVEVTRTSEQGFHLMEDMTDKAIAWVGQQKALAPHKPFFIYFAPGATHAPHHVPKAWADQYKGRFDAGWDELRERTFARQKAMGAVPADCELTPRHKEIPAWDDMPEAIKPALRRQMEVYAGFLEYADHHVGRLIDSLEKLKILDDTLIYYIIGDNGASAEGTLQGTFNEMINFNGLSAIETPEFLIERLDELGGPKSYNHFAVGWAHAMCTPYQWTKQVASHFGGTRNGTIVQWPNGIAARGEVRDQFHHVIDVAATVLEAAGLPEPLFVEGVQQTPLHGVSMAYSFDDPEAADRHETQYFEMFGNRGIYHRGWTAVTRHKTPWLLIGEAVPAFDDDVWELYDTTQDWTQAKDLSKQFPEKLHELQRLWLIEAVKYNVLPLDDDLGKRLNPRHRRAPGADPRRHPAALRGHGPARRERRAEHQEQVPRGHGGDRRRAGTGPWRHHRPGRQHRRLVAVRAAGPAEVLLQPVRRPLLLRRGPGAAHRGRAPGPHGVRLRRRRARQGRERHPLRRRRGCGPGPRGGDALDGLLGRRRLRRGP